ncbi:hypothetical protein DRE_06201 [Drechslerella stenobrocha 248]|uniref:Association with the SNF1 complex (ASC) domain-containing protein n=1 Tax=Drechslerella stenobrocha 248 TaxID=1043628 RepID=W7HY61_9PEZI|nr:hypothetical protein DRE_06201 [Drechslerella stenobrocha 248]
MGNAQSQQDGQSNLPGGASSGSSSSSSKAHHHFPHSATHHSRRLPQRKNSLSAAPPLKAAPTTSTTQDHDLLLTSTADVHSPARVSATPSTVSATEKLAGLTISTTPSSDSSPPVSIGGTIGSSIPRMSITQDPAILDRIDPIVSVDVPVPAPSRRRNSFGSATTVDTVELDEMNIDDTKAIPTTIEWTEGGKKVYVTGTFSGWKKKFRLSRSNGHLSTVVPLPSGTHHLKFLVDGQMKTSDAYPTAVDAAGILVNYIEVVADDMPTLERQLSTHSADRAPDLPSNMLNSTNNSFLQAQAAPIRRYTSVIPPFLEDLEERQEQYGRSVDSQLPPPPSLPMILSKVILNGASTIRDDSSVLPIPNHVVLNHLATSSIRNQVLAISATTRYKKKYVSTVLYMSTNTSDE